MSHAVDMLAETQIKMAIKILLPASLFGSGIEDELA